MSVNYNATIEYWGLDCPQGGEIYICEGALVEFSGCCLSDPCADGTGKCPKKDLRQATFSTDKYEDFPTQNCDSEAGKDNYYTCKLNIPPFFGCCGQNACAMDKCPRNETVPTILSSQQQLRLDFLSPPIKKGIWSTTLSAGEPTSTDMLVPIDDYANDNNGRASIGHMAVAGIYVAVMTAILLFISGLWRYWSFNPRSYHKKARNESLRATYTPVSDQVPPNNAQKIKSDQDSATDHNVFLPVYYHHDPAMLSSPSLTWLLGWSWDVVLTLVPVSFIALAIITIQLDGQQLSDYGEKVLELTRLSPTLYPILFAAVASRFYKSLARWCLEKSDGIRLAALEQIFWQPELCCSF